MPVYPYNEKKRSSNVETVHLTEAFEMAKDALFGCLSVYEDEGVEMPVAREPQDVNLEAAEYVALIEVDLLSYCSQTGTDCAHRENKVSRQRKGKCHDEINIQEV